MSEAPGKKARLSNVALSRVISVTMIASLVATSVVVGGAVVFMTSEQNRLGAERTRVMIASEVNSVRNELELLVEDYSNWTELLAAISEDDKRWLYENSGVSVPTLEGMDLNVVAPGGGAEPFGWIEDSGEEPMEGLVPPDLQAALRAALEARPAESPGQVGGFARLNGELWYLATTWINKTGVKSRPLQSDPPSHIFGRRLDADLMGEFMASTFVDTLRLVDTPQEGEDRIALTGLSGEPVAYLVWPQPAPGTSLLKRLAAPLLLTMMALAAVLLIARSVITGSARRLERALSAAQAADKAKTEFLANISHELRTPMNGIIGVAAIMKTTPLNDKQQHMVKLIADSGAAQMRIIEDLIDVSRIESGTASLMLAPFDLHETVSSVVDLLRGSAEAKALEYKFESNVGPGVVVLGDGQALRQVLTNLISNAVKFTDEGHVAIALDCEVRRDEANLSLTVMDTGPGIAPEHRTLIFERFAQVDASKSRRKGGSGLGLSISKSLVDMMGGRIEVESAPFGGSLFRVAVRLELVRAELSKAA
ncbi:MAG: ATP-binding protein [Pikeienuella sp.]|uniref:sensor histidine kinase n=1 Tax=Pikeienuella sp. TaxID=2831957 RepID=UPI00391B7C09